MMVATKKYLTAVRAIPVLGDVLAHLYRVFKKNEFQYSAQYWNDRYREGGNSGAGSYGRLALFKAEILNKLIRDENYTTFIEFGCGDGAQMSLLDIEHYHGIDVSESAVTHCCEKFKDDSTRSFLTLAQYAAAPFRADMSVSLDVVYHLVEDGVFDTYMHSLFGATSQCVVIYASNKDEKTADPHVRHRRFTDWVERNMPDWEQDAFIPNRYPFDWKDPQNTSFANFHIFKPNRPT